MKRKARSKIHGYINIYENQDFVAKCSGLEHFLYLSDFETLAGPQTFILVVHFSTGHDRNEQVITQEKK